MTHNCICTVVAMTRRRPSLDLSNEQCIVDTGCQLIGWNLTWTRPSCSGLVRGAFSLWGMAASHPCSSEGLSSHQVNTLECLVWCFFRLTSVPRSMFPTSARPASTICVDYGTSGAHWLRSLPRRSCTPSWRPASTVTFFVALPAISWWYRLTGLQHKVVGPFQ